METIYVVIIVVLFILAVLDIIVGVGNDAANFLTSARGARVAPFTVIMIVAALGVLFGAVTSDGMMEIARSGIFVPSMFSFHNIMIIFVGVMVTDILLLNAFNSLGLPTSTTVSIIFELLGASIMMALIVLYEAGQPFSGVLEYINSATALKIIFGILTSIIFAFVFGIVIQWIMRLIFSFDYQRAINKYGAIVGGLALSIITYFIVIKGLKQSVFMSKPYQEFIDENTGLLLLGSFLFWTVLCQMLYWIFKVNVLKVIILAGTFALALSFAGNDLVNFIGAPLAAWQSFTIYLSTGTNAEMTMGALSAPIATPTLLLLGSGVIMALTLWLSKHARYVTQTEINLSSQNNQQEQFGSWAFARVLVRGAINLSEQVEKILPAKVSKFISLRFNSTENAAGSEPFDLMRASVNLIVSSFLISLGTSYKLPLSTTYVTFIVAMSTSLADGAWGRESAVYRITGVFTVISGWFLTAFVAFTVCAVAVLVFYLGDLYTILPIFALSLFVLYRSVYRKAKSNDDSKIEAINIEANEERLDVKSVENARLVFTNVSEIFKKLHAGFKNYNRKTLKKTFEHSKELDVQIKKIKDSINYSIRDINEHHIDSSHHYVQVIDYLREVSRSITLITEPSYKHVNNNHRSLINSQIEELEEINAKFEAYSVKALFIMEFRKFEELSLLTEQQTDLFAYINKVRKVHIKRVKDSEVNTRNSLLYLQILHEFKLVLSFSQNVVTAHRNLIQSIQ